MKNRRLFIALSVLVISVLLGIWLTPSTRADIGWLIAKKLTVANATDLLGTLDVAGDTTVGGDLDVAGTGTFSTLTCTTSNLGSNLSVTNALTVTGATVLNGGLAMDSTAFTVANTSGNVGTTGTLTVGGVAALNGGLTMDSTAFTVANTSGNMATAGTATIGTFLVMTPGAAISVTAAMAIAPNSSAQRLMSAGAITDATLGTSGIAAGTLLRLVNSGSYSITILEGTTAKTASTSIALGGTYDAVLLMFDGTYWIQMSAVEDN